MGARGAIIMGFFGAVFAAMTLAYQCGWSGVALGLPFIAFAAISLAAILVIRRPGQGFSLPKQAQRVILWSSIGEGVGLFVAANVVVNLHRPDLLLPAMALVVGLHFLPIARSMSFRPFYALAAALLAAAATGFVAPAPLGGTIAGFTATAALWIAALLAVRREGRAKGG